MNDNAPADIPNRAGTSAVLPSFADIKVFLSADFDVATGLTFALAALVDYGVPNAPRDPARQNAYGRERENRRRPLLVEQRSIEEEARALPRMARPSRPGHHARA
jgi:DNA replication ATP-dependent helicase Dna2